jgi:hypothetical protein
VKVTLNGFTEILDGFGLGEARSALHQQVAIGQQGYQESVNEFFLSNDVF